MVPTKTAKEKEEQHRFFFWYKRENKEWIKNTLNKLGRKDLLNVLLPEKQEKKTWQRVNLKPVKHTFDDAIPSVSDATSKGSRRKKKHKSSNKRR